MTINTVTVENFIQPLQQRIHQQLLHYLPPVTQSPTQLHEAMHYAVFNGGKRVRPLLVYATGLSLQTDLSALDAAAAAIEFMHCYSLVHDDLPAMDDDDYRRGKLSCHKAFNEATAILVGDALQSLAFALLSQPNAHWQPKQQIQMVQVLAQAAGSLGMAGGQQLDIDHKPNTLSAKEREHIHTLKTGALFQASLQLGTLAANYSDNFIKNSLTQIGNWLGFAFQLQDDCLDGASSFATISQIDQLFRQVKNHLAKLPINTTPFMALIDYLIKRLN